MHTHLLDKKNWTVDKDLQMPGDIEVQYQQSSLSTWVATMVYLHSSLMMTDAEIHPNFLATALIPVYNLAAKDLFCL